MMKIETSYIYLEQDDLDEEDPSWGVIPILDDFLQYEIHNAGCPDDWKDGFVGLLDGFYVVTYEVCREYDYCDGYLEAEYDIAGALCSIEPSFKARILYYRNLVILPAVERVLSFFQRRWRVDFHYGGIGTACDNLFLHRAIYHRYFRKEHPWGKPERKEMYLT